MDAKWYCLVVEPKIWPLIRTSNLNLTLRRGSYYPLYYKRNCMETPYALPDRKYCFIKAKILYLIIHPFLATAKWASPPQEALQEKDINTAVYHFPVICDRQTAERPFPYLYCRFSQKTRWFLLHFHHKRFLRVFHQVIRMPCEHGYAKLFSCSTHSQCGTDRCSSSAILRYFSA